MANLFALATHTHPWKWLTVPRLIAAFPLTLLGARHFVEPDHFRNILLASGFPNVEFNMVAAPSAEVAGGVLMFLGLFGRLGGLLGVGTMIPAVYSTLRLMDPAALPPGFEQPPYVPPLPVPLLVMGCSALIVIFGAGKVSIDWAVFGPRDPNVVR